jgi:hypothetical protein
MIKLTKKTIKNGQLVKVIDTIYKLPTMKNSPWYKPAVKLTAYVDIGTLNTISLELDIDEDLEIIELTKHVRGVKYKRIKDGKIYSSYLGEFISFTRLINI